MRRTPTILLTALLMAAAVPALAQPPAKPATPPGAAGPPPSDVRCMMEMFLLSQQAQAQQKQTGQAGMLFFAGRISKGGAGPDLAAQMKSQLPTLQKEQVQSELPRCGAVFQATMRTIDSGFTALRPPAPPAGSPPPAAAAAPPPAAPAPK